jgi:uncharacterized protein
MVNKTNTSSYDYANRSGVLPVSWDDFHGICKALAQAVAYWQPEIIPPVGRGGFYPGTLLAHILQIEVFPIRLSRRENGILKHLHPHWLVEPPQAISGCKTLVVDEICDTGETLQVVAMKASENGASEIRSAVLYSHTWSSHIPDYIGIVSNALILNPWDREIYRDGEFRFHPELASALEQQGIKASADYTIKAGNMELAKQTPP